MARVDWRAVVAGAVAALVLALPAGLIGAIVVSDDSNNGVFAFFAIIMIGMLAGGFVAGSKRPDAPYLHGALASGAAYLGAQLVALVVKATRGSDLRSPVVYVFNLLLAMSFGVVGGVIAERRNARTGSTTP